MLKIHRVVRSQAGAIRVEFTETGSLGLALACAHPVRATLTYFAPLHSLHAAC
jgi:hypothetical protein